MYRPFEEFRTFGKVVSVIGSGGKTAFLRCWSGRLPGTVLLTTSTRILPFPGIPLVEAGPEDSPETRERVLKELRAAFAHSRVVCLGRPEPSGKLASPAPAVPFEALLPEADHILVEADGSAGRPLKAHRPFEPVIPACSDMTVCVVGASGIGRPVREVCHCPDRFSSLAGIDPDRPADLKSIAAVLNREALADWYLVNQVDTLRDPDDARRLCGLVSRDVFPCALAPR